jgi:hypothetical protein
MGVLFCHFGLFGAQQKTNDAYSRLHYDSRLTASASSLSCFFRLVQDDTGTDTDINMMI